MKYLDYPTRAGAIRESQDKLKALRPDAYVDGKGLPPGRQHGPGPRIPEGQGWTTMLEAVEDGAGSLDGRFLVRDGAGAEVADDEIKRPDIVESVRVRTR